MSEAPSYLSPSTRKATILWPPNAQALLHEAVHGPAAGRRERALMRLLAWYTREMSDPSSSRWITVSPL
jgi:hypothetical protein